MSWLDMPEEQCAVCMTHLPEIPHVDLARTVVKGQPITIVKNTHRNWVNMRRVGLLPPSPANQYDWPGRFKPAHHQRETVDHLLLHRKAFVLNGLGTGKTLTALWAADFLQQQGVIRRVLVVAPRSLCSHVWERELLLTVPHRAVAVCTGTRELKQRIARDTRIEWIIVNPESLHLLEGHLPMVDLVLVDEFTKFKSYRSKRAKALAKISADTRLWMMSGTPTPQSPLDAYAPCRLVKGNFMSYLQWRDITMAQVSQYRWIPRPGVEQTIAKHMQPAIRFRREDCYDLPDVAVEELTVELTDEQERLIRLLKQQAMANLQEGQITAANAAAVLSKVLQVMGGAVYSTINDERQQHQVPADNFFEVITDVVEQADAPVLVFAPFRGVVDRIYQALEDAGLRVGKITGDVPERERSQLFDAVQENRIDALVAVAGTMSHGLTLTTARYVIWALPPFSFEEYEQANGRVVRQGQRNNVTIYHVVHNPLAKELFNRLHSKSQLQEAVLTLLEDNTQREQ